MPELVSTEPTHPALVPSSLLRRAVFAAFAFAAVAVAAVAVALGASPPLPATCPASTTSTRTVQDAGHRARRGQQPRARGLAHVHYLLNRLKQLEQENAAQAGRAGERRAAPEEAHPSRGRRRRSERAGHRAQAQVVRSRLSRTVCRGARAPERADRGRIGPRRLRPGSEHCRGQGARPIPRARRVTTKHGPDALQPHGAPGRSWLAWAADAARDQHSLVAAVSTKSWPA